MKRGVKLPQTAVRIRKSRLDDASIQEIKAILLEFQKGERTEILTWKMLEGITGRSERNLRRYDGIYEAFWSAKDKNFTKNHHPVVTENALILDLRRRISQRDQEISAKDKEIESWRRKFVALVVNGDMKGINVRELWESAIPEKYPRR